MNKIRAVHAGVFHPPNLAIPLLNLHPRSTPSSLFTRILPFLSLLAVLTLAFHLNSQAGAKKVFGWVTFDDTKWGSGYSGGNIPADSLPWEVLTHVGLFAANGNNPPQSYYINQYGAFTARAHKSGVFAGITVGGSSDGALVTMVADPSLWDGWIGTYLGYLDQNKMDFIEFDFEGSYSASNIGGFFTKLYDALQTRWCGNDPTRHPFIVLTASVSHAISWNSSTIQSRVEFVNLMTYDYNNDAWGRVTFDNSPKSYKYYNGTGGATDSMGSGTNAIAPSMQRMAIRVSGAGWPMSKLTVGVDVNGGAWGGATRIRQSTSGTTTISDAATFANQWSRFVQLPRESIFFDQTAQAYWALVGTELWTWVTLPGRDSGMIATRKIIDSMGIGGVCFWNLGNEVWDAASTPTGGRGWFFSQIRKHFNFSGSAPPPPPPPPPPPTDTVRPTVSFARPLNGDSLTGTVSVQANAGDNAGVSRVQFLLDGSNLGSADYSSPYTISWNTDPVSRGNHTLSAVAYDNAGLSARRDIAVRLYSPLVPPPPPPPPPPPADSLPAPGVDSVGLYADGISPGFYNASWGATITWQSTERKYSGASAIKAVESAWGAVAFHSGSWSSPVAVEVAAGDYLKLSVYPETQATLRVELQNDLGEEFGYVTLSNVPAGRWSTYSVPLVDLNPNNRVIHEVRVQNYVNAPLTVHLDDLKFLRPAAPGDSSGGGGGGEVAGTLKYDKATLDLGSVQLGQQKTVSVNLSNPNDFPVTLADLRTTSSQFSARAEAGTIGPRSKTKVFVTFEPDSRSTFTSLLLAGAGASVKIDTLQLRGKGSWRSTGSVSTERIIMQQGPGGTAATDSFTVTNDGDLPLELAASTNQSVISVSPAAGTIAPGDSLTFHVIVAGTSTWKKASTGGQVVLMTAFGASDSIAVTVAAVGVDQPFSVPVEYSLSQNYPNPFNPTTTIGYALPAGGEVHLGLFNLLGQEVMVLADGVQEAGFHSVQVDAANLPSGVYFYRIRAGEFTEMKKMQLVR